MGLYEGILNELAYQGIMKKQASIGQLFPTFRSRVRTVAAQGGVTLVEQLPETWHFKVPSSKGGGVKYDVYVRFVNLEEMIKKFAVDRRLWNRGGTKVDLRLLASEIMNKVDIETDCACLTGDTKIPLLDSRVLTMDEIYNEFGTDKEFWVFSSDKNGNFTPKKARCLGVTGLSSNLVEVTLDNDNTIKCTYDHKFRMRDGSYKEAKDLKENDSLMPIYFGKTTKKGKSKYQQTYLTVKKNYYTGKNQGSEYKTIHRTVAELLLREEYEQKYKELIETGKEKYLVVHHKDFNSLNNDPSNLQWMGKIEHWQYHARIGKENAIAGTIKYYKDPVNKDKIYNDRSRAGKVCQEQHPDLSKSLNESGITFMKSDEGRELIRQRNIERWSDPVNHIKQSLALTGKPCGSHKPKSQETKDKMAVSARNRWQDSTYREKQLSRRGSDGKFNHKVKSVKFLKLEKTVPVYDLFVEDTHNFALDAGVYVHNCPADLYWGGEYIKTQRQAQYDHEENRPPDIRNRGRGDNRRHPRNGDNQSYRRHH